MASCRLHLGLCCLVSGWPLMSCEFLLARPVEPPVGTVPADITAGRAGKDGQALSFLPSLQLPAARPWPQPSCPSSQHLPLLGRALWGDSASAPVVLQVSRSPAAPQVTGLLIFSPPSQGTPQLFRKEKNSVHNIMQPSFLERAARRELAEDRYVGQGNHPGSISEPVGESGSLSGHWDGHV